MPGTEWAKKSSAETTCKTKTTGGKSIVQALEVHNAKFEKSVTKKNKSSSNKKQHYSSSSDSDSIFGN